MKPKSLKNKPKKVDYSEHIERYLDCPYCGTLITEYQNINCLFDDMLINCPHCQNDIQLGKCI